MAKRKQELKEANLQKENQLETGKVRANRKYKDTVFRMLFSDKENLLSLYNAVSGKTYADPEELQIVTLKNAVYMGMKNDLAFIVNLNLFLYEHQSTYNPNMPLRDLFYIASEYQKMVDHKSLYSSVLQMIPSPKFLVFYNGIEEIEDRHTECLSSAFENLIGEPDLELKVTTLNINEGHNQELMDQCKVLKEYVQYVAKVRSYVGKMRLDEAVACAVEECIQEGVLAEFLHKNRAEVEMVSIFEYNKEEEERKLRKAEYEGGYEAGKRRGLQDGEQLGIRKGIQETMLQMAKEFRLDDEAVIRLMCEKLEMDEKAAREMIHKE